MLTLINRGLSLIIAVLYLVLGLAEDGAEGIVIMFLYLLLPMACIWFGEEMGSYVGVMRGHLITSESPGCLVAAGGWLLLLLPFVAYVVGQIAV